MKEERVEAAKESKQRRVEKWEREKERGLIKERKRGK